MVDLRVYGLERRETPTWDTVGHYGWCPMSGASRDFLVLAWNKNIQEISLNYMLERMKG